MPITADLPDDIDALKQLVVARTVERDAFKVERDAAVAERDAAKAGLVNKTLEAEKLKFELARLKRMTFGASSERIKREIEQLELKLEELESDAAEDASTASSEPTPDEQPAEAREKKRRRQLPEHLPRTTETHEPVSSTCAACGSDRLRKVGEDVTEILEYIPGRFEVIRHVRPAYSCRTCEAMMQAPMPALPIPRGQAGPGLLAHVAIAKYCDHVPLYRQAEIYARDGVDLDRAMLADWVGRIAWLVRPLADRIGEHIMAGSVIHADDTPIPVLAPGNGKTRTGRLWVYLRDERPHCEICAVGHHRRSASARPIASGVADGTGEIALCRGTAASAARRTTVVSASSLGSRPRPRERAWRSLEDLASAMARVGSSSPAGLLGQIGEVPPRSASPRARRPRSRRTGMPWALSFTTPGAHSPQ